MLFKKITKNITTLIRFVLSNYRNSFFNWNSLHAGQNSHYEVQMNIYQSNAYGKDLSWPYFDVEPRVQERQQVKDHQSCVSVLVAYLTIPSSNKEHQPRHSNSHRFIEIQSNLRRNKLHRTNQDPIEIT